MASYQIQYGNYVKFLRGTPTSWNKIPEGEKNSDTLYFISETGSNSGKLYLGSKLISNGDLTSSTSLADLNDVLINEGITDNSLLVYNEDKHKWEAKSLLDILLMINDVFQGATEETNGKVGLVPVPKAGEQNLFLRGDATWANPVEIIQTTIDSLEEQLNTLIGEDEGKSVRDIAGEIFEEQIGTDPDVFDSLKDLAEWFEQHPEIADLSEILEKINQLDETVNGTEEPFKEGLVQVTSNLSISVQTLEGDVNEIKYALKWQDILEE